MAATRTAPQTSQNRVVNATRLASLAGFAFLGLLALLHVLKPELDPSWRMVSEYEIGRHGWVMTVAFLCLAVGTAALLPAIRNEVTGRPAGSDCCSWPSLPSAWPWAASSSLTRSPRPRTS